jgi:hypothetical protein
MRQVTWIVIALAALGAAPAQGDPKTQVSVRFVLEEPTYRPHFTPAQIAELESKAAVRIVQRLKAYAPFLDFTTDAGRPFTLTIRLNAREPSQRTAAPTEVGLHLGLAGPKIASGATDYVVFRKADNLDPIGAVETLVEEIDGRLPEAEIRGRVAELLHQVPIARKGLVLLQPVRGWILPHRPGDICMELGSELAIESAVPTPVGVRQTPRLEALATTEYDPQGPTPAGVPRGQVFSEPKDPNRFQQELGSAPAERIAVNGVWIVKYFNIAGCPDPARP